TCIWRRRLCAITSDTYCKHSGPIPGSKRWSSRAGWVSSATPDASKLRRVPIAGVTGSLTSLIGNHGLYAVFGLMAIDAVFPAASELVMLYAGALAAGAFAGQHVDLFGGRISSHAWAYAAMALAGTLGYLVGSIVGWAIGLYGGRAPLARPRRRRPLSAPKIDRGE